MTLHILPTQSYSLDIDRNIDLGLHLHDTRNQIHKYVK